MLVRTLSQKEIIQVVCGSKHMMCLTSEGLVYSWGSGENGVLGHGSMSSYDKPEVIKELKMSYEIVFIAAGMFSSAAISSTGQLFTWGRGKYGVLGIGSEESVCIPTLVSNDKIKNEQIFYVSLGLYHTLALSIDKKAFAWGYSEKGRLGCVDKIDCDQKKRITVPKEITALNGKNLCQIYADCHHGNRPSFINAAKPEIAAIIALTTAKIPSNLTILPISTIPSVGALRRSTPYSSLFSSRPFRIIFVVNLPCIP